MKLVFATALFAAVVLFRAYGDDANNSCTCNGYIKGTDGQETIIISANMRDNTDCSQFDECSKTCFKWAQEGSKGGNLCTIKDDTILGDKFCAKIQNDITNVQPQLRHTLCGKQGETDIGFFQAISCKGGKYSGECKQ